MQHFADRLAAAVEGVGSPVCVGLDPVVERLPEALRQRGDDVTAIERFSIDVLDAIAKHAAIVKPQSACYERYGSAGVAALQRVIDAAADRGLMVVLDAKRGDIGISARHYAAATIGRQGIDAVTVSGYLGPDTLEPFVEVATEAGKGLFVLVRTSNPGSEAVQSQRLEDGRSVAEAMADLLVERGRSCIGESGYSAIGAVVGATHPADLLALRQRMARQVLLLPGYGAQGASADDIAPAFDDRGRGAIVTASRSVIYPFDPADRDWQTAIAAAAEGFAREVARVARG